MPKKSQSKILRYTLLSLLVFMLGAWFYAHRLASDYAQAKMERLFDTRVEFSHLQMDFLQRRVLLHKVKIFHPEGSQRVFSQIEKIWVKPMGLPFTQGFYQVELGLVEPKINLVTNQKGEWELAGRFPILQRSKEQKLLKPFDVENLVVEDGEITLQDGFVNKTTLISEGELYLKSLRLPSAKEPYPSEFEAEWRVGDAKMELKGKGNFLSSKTSLQGEWTVKDLFLPPYEPYYDRGDLPVKIQKGVATFVALVNLKHDRYNVPIQAEVEDLELALKKKNALKQFASKQAVKSLTNEEGEVQLEMLLEGTLTRPRFTMRTNFTKAALAGVGESFKEVGSSIKKGSKKGFKKVKNFFSGKK